MRTLLALSVVVLALGCSSRSTRPTGPGTGPVAKGTVYSAPTGESVSVVPLLPPEAQQFLILFQVPGDDHDGKVLLVKATENETEFWARWRGRNMRLFQERKSRRKRTGDYMISRLLQDGSIHVKPDAERTATLKSEDVQALYLRQLADGTLARGEAFDKPFWTRDHDRQLGEALKATNTACGSTVAAAIVWDSVPDKLIDDGEAIGAYCARPLEALKTLCDESEEARRTVQAKVKRLDCRAGERFGGRIEADTVLWSVAPGTGSFSAGPEQDMQFFMDNL